MLDNVISPNWRFSDKAITNADQFGTARGDLAIPTETGILTLNDIDGRIESGEAVVLRKFGSQPEDLILLGRAMGSKFHTPIGRRVISTLETIPFRPSVAESTAAIPFHTDFASDQEPPDVLALVCVTPDPRHPQFGRNQVASVSKVIAVINQLFPETDTCLADLTIPVGTSEAEQVGPILSDGDARRMVWPAPIINRDRLEKKHYINDCSIVDLIEEIGKSVCDDIALDAGDLLLVDNRTALHRRGECTVSKAENGWIGRKIMTARWFR